jgi:hypothetical protein
MNEIRISVADGIVRDIRFNGLPLADVAHAEASFGVRELTTVELTMNIPHVEIEGTMHVRLDPSTVELLRKLGWTPPKPSDELPVGVPTFKPQGYCQTCAE